MSNHDETHGDAVLDFFCLKQEPIRWPISSRFLCRAQLSLWTDNVLAKVRFFLRCFIDAV